MKKSISFLLFILNLLCTQINAQNLNFQWAGKMGSVMQDEGNAISVDTLGNTYSAGIFLGNSDFDPSAGTYTLASTGGKDIFISKLNNLGNFIWAKRIGGVNDDYATSIAVDDSGNVFVTGYFAGIVDFDPSASTFTLSSVGGFMDIFILKLDVNGNFKWVKRIGATNPDYGYGITLDKNGNIYTTGSFGTSCDFDPGIGTFTLAPYGIFVMKLDKGGNFKWAKQMGSQVTDEAYAIKTDRKGNVYTTGQFSFSGDFDPSSSTFSLTSNGVSDIFVSKLDSLGNFIWAKQIGGSDHDQGNAIAIDTSFNVYLTGSFRLTCDFDPSASTYTLTSANAHDIFTEKLGPNGNFLWAFRMGGTSTSSSDIGTGIQVDNSGNVYTIGNFLGNIDFDPGASTFLLNSGSNTNIYIHKVSTTGSFIWAGQIGAGTFNFNNGKAIALDKNSNVYATGSFVSTNVDFDTGTNVFNLSSTGAYDIFILKLSNSIITDIKVLSNNQTINLFPNPNNGLFNLQVDNKIAICKLTLVNQLGQLVFETHVNAGENFISVPNLSSGLYNYFLSIDGEMIYKGKLIIE